MSEPNERTPVLVVGAGPTGLLASILLSKQEIPHVLVEQRAETVGAPAAHVINTRTMEIYRQAGIDVAALYALNHHPLARLVTWKSGLERDPIGTFDMAANRDALLAQSRFSTEHTTNISQHLLEDYLKSHAEKSAFADIRFGVEWMGFASDDKQASRLRGSDGQEVVVGYQYLLAADGAGSPIARTLDIRKVGPDAIATFLNLTCEVDVAQASGEDATLLYWLLDPDVQGTIIVHDPHGLAVYMRPIAVPYESIDDYDDARCERILKQVFGDQPCRIRHKGVWKMTAQVADRFRDGPVFLIGDSIHRFPPTGGLGLNTGAGDVHNLVWKLAAALKGDASAEQIEALLDSYEIERRPVAQRNCDVSRRNNEKMTEVVRALGLDPAKAGLLAKTMNSRLVKVLPQSVQDKLRAVLIRPVKSQLRDAQGHDDKGRGIRARVVAAIDNQREHFSSLGLDLGYVYREGCVAANAGDTPGSEVTTYTETVGAGARFPHRPLSGVEQAQSLHDLFDYTSFTLLSSGNTEVDLPETFGVGVSVVDLDELRGPGERNLVESLGLPSNGWVLVRPDGHVMLVS